MKRAPYFISVAALLLCLSLALASCAGDKNGKSAPAPQAAVDADTIPVDADQYVRIETSEGDITLRLFRDTPRHRHNFVKLAQRGYYDGKTFYRIISGSLIIENIFTIPGVGGLYLDSINALDYNFFLLLTGFYTFVGLLSNILIDISYGFIDPRIRMGAR